MRPVIRVLPAFVCTALVAALFAVASARSGSAPRSGSDLALAMATVSAGQPLPNGAEAQQCVPTDNTAVQCACPPDLASPAPSSSTANPTIGPSTPTPTPSPTPVPAGFAPPQPNAPTTFRVATFNLRGFHHTDVGGDADQATTPDGCTRMAVEVSTIQTLDLDIVGFQEMQTWPQMNAFRQLAGGTYDIWPGSAYATGTDPGFNMSSASKWNNTDFDGTNIAWNKTRWALVPGTATTYQGPEQCGFTGTVSKPVVMLQSLQTGQRVWVLDTHHPAQLCKAAQSLRDASVDAENAEINALRAADPTVPVILTGDMNSPNTTFFCRSTAGAGLISPAGGANPARNPSACTMPANPQIDWIMSTPDITWDGYASDGWPQLQKATDHPVIFATAHIRPQAAQGISHVILLDAEGLPAQALTSRAGKHAAHTLASVVKNGAGTTNARTVDSGLPLPNLTSLITGRPVARALDGHGVKQNKAGKSLQKMGHVYSPSIFDRVHDYGGSTAFVSSDTVSRVVARSYDAHNGAPDSQGWSFGRNKISASKFVRNDAGVTASVLKNTSRTLTVAQFTGLRVAGSRYGYLSSAYYSALKTFSQQVARILKAARATPGTLVILTADTGGHGYSTKGRSSANYRVPIGVVGPAVARGNLYSLSAPNYQDPAGARGTLGSGSAIRNGDVANLVTTVLGLPALGSLDQSQGLNVFARS